MVLLREWRYLSCNPPFSMIPCVFGLLVGMAPDIPEDHIDDMIFPLLQPARIHDVDFEDGVERVLMSHVIGRQAGNGDVEIDRVDTGPEQALLRTFLQQVVQGIDKLLIHFTDQLRLLDVFAAMEVFARQ